MNIHFGNIPNMPKKDYMDDTHRQYAEEEAQSLACSVSEKIRNVAGIVRSTVKRGLLLTGMTFLVAAPSYSPAAPLDLSSSPLFLGISVPPNILFLGDDSGSMDWNLMTKESDGIMRLPPPTATAISSYQFIFGVDSTAALPDEAAIQTIAANKPANDHGVWRARFHGYNKIYYNPEVRYSPWQGVDAAGVTFANSSITAARRDPYVTTGGTNVVDLTATMTWTTGVPDSTGASVNVTTNLNPAMYYTWTDTNSNGIVDASDAHTKVQITSATATYSHASGNRSDCVNPLSCTYAEESRNFANWFTYYRRRVLTALNAIGKVVAPSNSRMGYATLNNNNSVNTQISLMNSSLTSGNKKALLDKIYQTNPGSMTPLRTALDKVGKYYECVSGNIFGLTAGSASCPILPAASGGSCQQNFTIAMTDGYYNDSFSSLPGDGNTDADGASPNAAGNTTWDGGLFADTYGNTLADVAMHYYERDLSTLPDNLVVVPGVDDAKHQHMVTFTVAFGVDGTLTADPTVAGGWPNPAGTNNPEKIDDLRHAAFNGRGEFLNASDPADLVTGLSDALSNISGRTGSAAAIAVNSRSLNSDTAIYQARFTSGDWDGELRALPVSLSGTIGAEIWNAGTQLKSQNWDTGRKIVTRNGATGVGFRWANLNATQQASLNDNPATAIIDNDTKGPQRLNYLRGDHTDEPVFRTRAGGFKLGDIVNSSPVYVGPSPYLPDIETVPHSSFRTAYSSRTPIIYVGANDGMLHGFEAATGNEKIAYVPNAVYPNLGKLTDPTYVHTYYVDATPTVSDVFGTFNGCSASPCWRTVLVAGLGGGGKSIYALDVTDPSLYAAGESSNANKISLWEITDTDLGLTYGRATIAKVKYATNDYRWAAIFGNGYNSTNEKAVLYIVDIQTGALFTSGGSTSKIVLDNTVGGGNGLSAPAVVDYDGDYIADYVYAGDLKGNMWKVDISGSLSAWGSAYKTGSTPKPLFKAVDAANVAQPITTRPEVGDHPGGLTGLMLYFGTGKYLENGDKSPKASPVHTFYGVWDRGVTVTRADLLPQTISNSISNPNLRVVTDTPIIWRETGTTACAADGSGRCLGWRDDLPTTGEMTVSNSVLIGGSLPRVIFNTLIPGTDPCSFGGSGWLMELNPKNGGRMPEAVLDVNGDGVFDANDLDGGVPPSGINLGIGIASEPTIIHDSQNKKIYKGESGSTGEIKLQVNSSGSSASGRQSWRQLK
jgi:type IV pilus assembly protein PilY1